MKQIKSWLLVKAAMIAALFGVAANVNAEDKFYIPDFSIEAGETKELAIQFESDKVSASDPSQLEYVAFQFDIYMPEGLTIVQKKGKYNFTFNTERNDDHTFSPALQADGAIRVAAASLTNAYFWETSGDFVYFSVTAAADFAGDHEITMKTINFSDIEGNMTTLADVTTKVTGPAAGDQTVAVTGITLDKATAEVTEGESLTLVATVAPDNATDKTVVWSSSDETVATVKDGVVTTLKAGEATITAKAGEQTATCVVTVKAKVVETGNNKFYLPDFSIEAGETKELAIQFESDNVSASDPSQLNYVAFQFDIYLPEGLTIVQKKGKYNFTFNTERNDDHTFSPALQADGAIRVAAASLTNAYFWETSGDFVYFSVTAAADFAGDHEITMKTINFSDIEGNMTTLADVTTKVTGPAAGDQTVAVTGITLDKATAEVTEGESLTLVATVAPDNATDKTVVWSSSDETVATVKDGVVTTLKAGEATITAKAGEQTATCVVTVKAKVIAVTGITLDKATAEVTEGESLTLVATVAPDNATDKTVVWSSSDETVATVKDGVVTTLKAGEATITAKAGEQTATCVITVKAKVIAVTGITLDKATAEVTEGESLTLVATVAPDNATDKTVVWSSSDETVATVKDGVVTTLKAGEATITAKAGEQTATCVVTVKAKVIAVTGITLDKATAELTEGESLTLVATVAPDNATDKTVVWSSSDETVATVKDGVVTTLKAGEATITAKAGEQTATCVVTVKAKVIAVTGITLDKATAELTEGESLTLVATVAPDNATDKTVVWSSSDETVATVKDGVVTTLKAGEATITAKAGEQTATCVVTVKAKVIAVTGITLDKATAELTEGESLTLVATVAPDNATDKTVVWSSSDETVATVKDGVVTTLKAGEATITAKAGEQTATCVVTVKENDPNAAQVTVFDFEDDNILFTCDSRISASVVSGEQTIKGTKENTITLASKAVRFAGAGNAQNGYCFAHYDFSSLVEKAKTVTVEFDYWNTDGARAIISLGDASVRGTTGNSSKMTYSEKGAIFALGSNKDNALLNGAKLSKADYCDKWLVVSVAVDVLNATYSYSIKDKATGTEIKSASDIAYYSSEALACSQIDLFGCINNSTPALLDNIVITVEKDNRVYADYKVRYVDEAGVEVKEAAVRNGAANEAAGIMELDKESFKNADASKKYIYKSDDSEGKTIAEDGSTVITVTFREAAKYNYSVEAIDDSGSLALTLGSYSDFEGENAKAPYYAYVLNEGVFYEAAAVNKEYNKYITLTQDNMKVQVAYTKSAIENVVYYQEAENVEGLTKVTTGNTSVRSSNSASAYAAEADVVLTNLAPGKYKMTAVVYDASKEPNAVFSFIAGADTVLKAKAKDVNWTSNASEEFTLTVNTALSLAKGGGNMQAVDFFYIQKTGEAPARFDLTAYNDTVAWANEIKATLNAEDETEAEVITAIDDFIASAAQWLEETLADPEATQSDVDFIAQDLKAQINAVMSRVQIMKMWPEVDAARAQGDSIVMLYPEDLRTDEAGLIVSLQSLPRVAMWVTSVEELQASIKAVNDAIVPFQVENNSNVADSAAITVADAQAVLAQYPNGTDEAGLADSIAALNTLLENDTTSTTYPVAEVLAAVEAVKVAQAAFIVENTSVVTGITLDKTTAELTEGETLTLVATVVPETAIDKTVTWTSSDETIATVVDGVVSTLKAGEVTITAKAGEQTATCVITVKAKEVIVIPEDAFYFWQGAAGGAAEKGGVATGHGAGEGRVNYANGEYYTLSISGKKANIDTDYILITLDQPLEANDKLEITAYRNKDTDANGTLYILFENGQAIDEGDNIVWNNVALGQEPNTNSYNVGEGAGSKTIKLSRSKSSTNVFITKFVITRSADGIEEVEVVVPAENVIYNLQGQKLNTNSVDELPRGLYIINGKKVLVK